MTKGTGRLSGSEKVDNPDPGSHRAASYSCSASEQDCNWQPFSSMLWASVCLSTKPDREVVIILAGSMRLLCEVNEPVK